MHKLAYNSIVAINSIMRSVWFRIGNCDCFVEFGLSCCSCRQTTEWLTHTNTANGFFGEEARKGDTANENQMKRALQMSLSSLVGVAFVCVFFYSVFFLVLVFLSLLKYMLPKLNVNKYYTDGVATNETQKCPTSSSKTVKPTKHKTNRKRRIAGTLWGGMKKTKDELHLDHFACSFCICEFSFSSSKLS